VIKGNQAGSRHGYETLSVRSRRHGETGGIETMDGISESVIEALREQGFEVHESVMSTEGMIYGVRSPAESAWVKGGEELLDLAAGRITLAEIAVRQPKQKPAPGRPVD